MKFHSPFVRFLNHEFHGIVVGKGWLSLNPGEPLAPGFVGRRIKGIGCRPHLHDNSVNTIAFMEIEQAYKGLLL